MVKNILSNLSRGIFYTIGKILGFLFVGLVIATIISKLDPNYLRGFLS